mmetsp:Transcript_7219/g.16943  ORF Transcript_7219/g.16943 Transcript_7219/m.16943 type:complete len:246 (-) Transcript_7219:337-1074(-)
MKTPLVKLAFQMPSRRSLPPSLYLFARLPLARGTDIFGGELIITQFKVFLSFLIEDSRQTARFQNQCPGFGKHVKQLDGLGRQSPTQMNCQNENGTLVTAAISVLQLSQSDGLLQILLARNQGNWPAIVVFKLGRIILIVFPHVPINVFPTNMMRLGRHVAEWPSLIYENALFDPTWIVQVITQNHGQVSLPRTQVNNGNIFFGNHPLIDCMNHRNGFHGFLEDSVLFENAIPQRNVTMIPSSPF